MPNYPPFRQPCNGSALAVILSLGDCSGDNQYNPALSSIPIYINTTQVNRGDPPTASAIECNGTDYGPPLCGSGPSSSCHQLPNNAVEGNCYCPVPLPSGSYTDDAGYAIGVTSVILSAGTGPIVAGITAFFSGDTTRYTITGAIADITPGDTLTFSPPLQKSLPTSSIPITFVGTHDFGLCHNAGWKAVRASKIWQGCYGFDAPATPDCNNFSDTKYRQVIKSATGTLTYSTGTVTSTAAITTTVHPHTGELTTSGCSTSDPLLWTFVAKGVEIPPVYVPIGASEICATAINSWATDGVMQGVNGGPNSADNTGIYDMLWRYFPDGGFSIDIGADYINITASQSSSAPDGSGAAGLSLSIELSEEYPLSDCIAEAEGLLGSWPLADDAVYPWRMDTNCMLVPLVTWNETDGTPAVPMELLGYRDETLNLLYLKDPCPTASASQLELLLGNPLPAGYGPHCSFDPITAKGNCNNGLIAAYQNAMLPDTATWWDNTPDMPDGAFGMLVGGSIVIVQKWAGTKPVTPSINFFRPCGADRDVPEFTSSAWPICGRCEIESQDESSPVNVVLSDPAPYLRAGDLVDFLHYDSDLVTEYIDEDSVTVITSSDSTHFIFDSDDVDAATHIKSHNAPSYKWNDNSSKGDCCILTWTTEPDPDTCNPVTTAECTSKCLPAPYCSPAVIYISPSTERFLNSVRGDWGATSHYGQWQSIALFAVPDPYDLSGAGDLVEAMCSVPSGSPILGLGSSDLPYIIGYMGFGGTTFGGGTITITTYANTPCQMVSPISCAQPIGYCFTLDDWI